MSGQQGGTFLVDERLVVRSIVPQLAMRCLFLPGFWDLGGTLIPICSVFCSGYQFCNGFTRYAPTNKFCSARLCSFFTNPCRLDNRYVAKIQASRQSIDCLLHQLPQVQRNGLGYTRFVSGASSFRRSPHELAMGASPTGDPDFHHGCVCRQNSPRRDECRSFRGRCLRSIYVPPLDANRMPFPNLRG